MIRFRRGGQRIHERHAALLFEKLLQIGPLSAPIGSDLWVEVGSLGHRNDEMKEARTVTFDLVVVAKGTGIPNDIGRDGAQIRKTT